MYQSLYDELRQRLPSTVDMQFYSAISASLLEEDVLGATDEGYTVLWLDDKLYDLTARKELEPLLLRLLTISAHHASKGSAGLLLVISLQVRCAQMGVACSAVWSH